MDAAPPNHRWIRYWYLPAPEKKVGNLDPGWSAGALVGFGPGFCYVANMQHEAMGIKEVVTAPRSPWKNPYVERVIGSIRREYLDHIVIFNERHLRRVLTSYRDYYHRSRTHLSLQKDCPNPRPVQSENQAKVIAIKVIAIEEVGGLHHRYERRAA